MSSDPALIRRGSVWFRVAMMAFAAVVCIVLATGMAIDSGWFGLVFLLPAALSLWLGWRAIVGGVRLSDDGVTVINWFNTRQIAWSNVAAFELDDYGLRIRCADGSVVLCSELRRNASEWSPAVRTFGPTLRYLEEQRVSHQAQLAERGG